MKRLLVLPLLALATAASAASIDAVRSNVINYYTAAGADRNSPRMQQALSALEATARSYGAPGYLLSDGSWADINYNDVPDGAWSPWDHTRRLMVMAKAYRTPGQSLYNDPLLRSAIESALNYVSHYYGVTTWPAGNWWFWSIGVPLDLGPTLVLMRGDISDSVYTSCVNTLAFHIGSSPTAKALVGPLPTGENLVWSAHTHLSLALLRDDPAILAAVRDAMTSVCLPTTGDGIQNDSSFHQHGAQLYTGGYGASFANDVARYALITRGTEYQLTPAAFASFSNYVADGIAWSLYGNYFDVSAIGRYVANPYINGYDGVAALLQASQVTSPRQSEIRVATEKMLESWTWTLPPELAALAHDAPGGSWPAGHQHYFASDYTVHRRPGWFASIKMFSARTKSGENTNGENLLGSRESDGRFYLVQNGNEFFGSDTWAALDWSRLPGITVEQKATTADNTYGVGTRSFVGGTGDGQNGVSAMDYAPLNSSVTAKKAWFFFNNTIVFLTNSITSTTGNRVETIIDQRPMTTALTNGGNWAVANGVGYWFYGRAPQMQQITRTGNWAALGASADATPRTSTFTTLWIDHGTMPVNETAAYAIVPGASASTMRSFIAPSILANDANATAVRNADATAIVFWSAGKIAGVQSDSPAIVYLTPKDIYVCDPANGAGTFTITLPQGRLTVPRNGGRTFHAHLVAVRRRPSR